VVGLDGEEYLQYKHNPIDIVISKGSVADENGNLTVIEKDNGCTLGALALKSSGFCNNRVKLP